MDYEVTAIRKRPRGFDTLVGQDFVVDTLKNSIEKGTIAHAYLFSGPRGVGKTSTARILASALNCDSENKPCLECPSCLGIKNGTSIDVIEIDGASNTSVNDVRVIKDEVLFAPTSSKYKIYIIDEVHMLSNSAFNALLKTIEEPPAYVVFIFATTEIHKVPATIRSRCQQFNFRLIDTSTIKNLLGGICAEKGIKADDDAILWIAKEGSGSLRDAYTLFDQVVAFSGNEITLEKIKDKLGLVGAENIDELFLDILANNQKDAILLVNDILKTGVSVEQLIVEICDYLRTLLLIKSGIKKESIIGYRPDKFEKSLEGFTLFGLEKSLGVMLTLYRDIRFSVNQLFELELAICKLCKIKDMLTREEILSELTMLKATLLNSTSHKVSNEDGYIEKKSSFQEVNSKSDVANRLNEVKNVAQENLSLKKEASESKIRMSGFDKSNIENKIENQTGNHNTIENKIGNNNFAENRVETSFNKNSEYLSPNTSDTNINKDKIREKVISILSKSKPFVIHSLKAAKRWEIIGSDIRIYFDNEYHLDQTNSILKDITAVIESITGRVFNISTIYIELDNLKEIKKKETDEQLEMAKEIFLADEVGG